MGDEGGFAPDFSNAGEVFACLQRAVEEAGYKVGSDVAFAMDAAASELYSEEDGMYHFPGEAQTHAEWMSICGVRTRRAVLIHLTHM